MLAKHICANKVWMPKGRGAGEEQGARVMEPAQQSATGGQGGGQGHGMRKRVGGNGGKSSGDRRRNTAASSLH